MAAEAVLPGDLVAEAAPPRNFNLASIPVSKIEWPQTFAAVFFGLLVALLLSLVFRGGLPLGMLATGYFSVYLYHRRHPLGRLTLAFGARLGAFTGAFGFGVLAILTIAATVVSQAGPEIHALILKAIQEYAGRNSDPQMQQVLEFYGSRNGFILLLVLGSFFTLALFMALSTVGGMIGAAMLERKGST